jgi:hypothetical protein
MKFLRISLTLPIMSSGDDVAHKFVEYIRAYVLSARRKAHLRYYLTLNCGCEALSSTRAHVHNRTNIPHHYRIVRVRKLSNLAK